LSYFLIAVYSVAYAIKSLCRSSISKQSRNIVFLRHVLSIVGFLFAQLYFMLCMLPLLDLNEPIAGFFPYVLFSTQGIYMPLLRISEPFFFSIVSVNIQNIIQRLYGLPPIDFEQTRS
jgi:hypothetical protein